MKIYYLKYSVDKKKYSDFFWENYRNGEWYHFEHKPKLIWWKLYQGVHEITINLQHELNIFGMNNFPRFQYQFPNSFLPPHIDEDNLSGILFNLRDEKNSIVFIETKKIAKVNYENNLLAHFGGIKHAVLPVSNPRLVLKFSIRHPWEEIMERLDKKNLIDYVNLPY